MSSLDEHYKEKIIKILERIENNTSCQVSSHDFEKLQKEIWEIKRCLENHTNSPIPSPICEEISLICLNTTILKNKSLNWTDTKILETLESIGKVLEKISVDIATIKEK